MHVLGYGEVGYTTAYGFPDCAKEFNASLEMYNFSLDNLLLAYNFG